MFGEIVGAWLIETWRVVGSPSPVQPRRAWPRPRHADGRHPSRRREGAGFCRRDPSSPRRDQSHAQDSPGGNAGGIQARHRMARDLLRCAERPPPPRRQRILRRAADPAIRAKRRRLARARRRPRCGGTARHSASASARSRSPGPGSADVADGRILEIRPAADALIAEIARRIVEHGGAALIIDYGYEAPPIGDTLQAVRGHEYADPLDSPGEADLTAHVDFGALARSARAAGASVHGPMNQGDFLVSLGLLERAGGLGAKADEATRETLRLAVERLAGPDQMGRLFKAIAIAPQGTTPPPFYDPGPSSSRSG